MTSTTIANEISMPPNSNSVSTSSSNINNSNNCGSNQQSESLFTHHLHHHHQQLHSSNSQTHYQSIALPTINASSSFYTPHFTMQQFSPITPSSTPIGVSTAVLTANGSIAPSINSLNQPGLYGSASSNEDTSVNSSNGSGSLNGSNCSAVSSCSAENGGTSSSGSISSLTSASQYELYHANSPYSKYRQTEIKPEANANCNEKYLHAFSKSDIALATKPGSQIYFDPSICHFSDEDLRPQPMNKKSRKQNVPDCLKDEKYWARRAKNNVAAKKSREQRRLKENRIFMRCMYLEKRNLQLETELAAMSSEHTKLNFLPQ